MLPPPSFQSPTQIKGDGVGLDYAMDSDHRKRRRNRTTQSCLNCHTSKRKCDRKRPCQRCIQLGLTGLCVYEIDDPALRDDPSIDESTRQRNRIAELESLVRELRGKPHPRWADSTFRDGDPAEKWHSRASRGSAVPHHGVKRRGVSPSMAGAGDGAHGTHSHHANAATTATTRTILPSGLTPIKTEPLSEITHTNLYRFSSPDDPSASMRYTNGYPPPSPTHNGYENAHAGHRHTYSAGSSGGSSTVSYATSSSAPAMSYGGHLSNTHHHPHQHHPAQPSSYSDGGSVVDSGGGGSSSSGYHHVVECDDDRQHGYHAGGPDFSPDMSPVDGYCPCRNNPTIGHSLIALSNQLQNTIACLRQFGHHHPQHRHEGGGMCRVYRRALELQHILHSSDTDSADNASTTVTISNSASSSGPSYDPLPTPESDIISPLSASSTPYHGPPSIAAPRGGHDSPHEWSTSINVAGYNPYFPMQPSEHPGYGGVIGTV